VLVGRGQDGAGDGGTVVGAHDSLGQQIVAEQASHQEVLPEQLLEQL